MAVLLGFYPLSRFPQGGRAERLKIAQWAILATEPDCRGDIPLGEGWEGG